MMKNLNNVFAQEIRIFRNEKEKWMGGSAWEEGDRILEAAISRDYLEVSDEQLCVFIRSAFRAMDERNLVNIFPGERMPSDAFAGIVLQPSYATVVLCVYLKVKLGAEKTVWMDEDLRRLMDTAFRNRISGHGFEQNDMIRKVMLALGRAGLDEFLPQAAGLSKAFERTVSELRNIIVIYGFDPENENILKGSLSGTPCLMSVAAAIMGVVPVFVYGTLMSGQPAEDYLGETARFGGYAELKGYAMYDLGSFPGIRPKTGEAVVGELYFVDDAAIARLDRYEGEGSLYRRTQVEVTTSGGCSIPAEAYIYNHPVSGKPVRQRWGTRDEDEVWYAAYGSNLKPERFGYYIEGGLCPWNGKEYSGCRDKSPWKETAADRVRGEVYFAKSSPSWNGGGVAFFRPDASVNAIVRRYRITWGQLKDIQRQEGAGWYHRILFLKYEDGLPVYTLTSEQVLQKTEPDPAYLELLREALTEDCGCTEREADRYIRKMPGVRKRNKKA